MRFAWLREKSGNQGSVTQSLSDRLVYLAYNAVWWLPILLGFTKLIDYQTAFITFFVLMIIRAGVNLYRNNIIDLEQAESFPLRAV